MHCRASGFLFVLWKKTVLLVQFCQRKEAKRKERGWFSVVFGAKVPLGVVVFQFFCKKTFTNFRKGDTMGQKGNF